MLFWRPTQNFYARDGVHLNSLGQGKYHRSLRGAILASLSLFSTISSCWIFNVSFHFPMEPFKVYVLSSPCLCFSDSRLCYWLAANAAYQGLQHPVEKTEDGKYLPDYTYRYMTEEIAEIVGVETPDIDKVLLWRETKMGKQYMVNSKIQGKDVTSSPAPQRYGFTTLESIL